MVKGGVIDKVKFNRLVLPTLYRFFKQKYLYLIMNTNSNYPLEININIDYYNIKSKRINSYIIQNLSIF